MIYAIPALDTAILEIDAVGHKARPSPPSPAPPLDPRTAPPLAARAPQVTKYGMLPAKGIMTDKWNGGVLAPNGKVRAPRLVAPRRTRRRRFGPRRACSSCTCYCNMLRAATMTVLVSSI
jgi:hypothetical protein